MPHARKPVFVELEIFPARYRYAGAAPNARAVDVGLTEYALERCEFGRIDIHMRIAEKVYFSIIKNDFLFCEIM